MNDNLDRGPMVRLQRNGKTLLMPLTAELEIIGLWLRATSANLGSMGWSDDTDHQLLLEIANRMRLRALGAIQPSEGAR
ncbi:MAG: hypothetical protein KF683_00895 [Rubrivivax sp.]|nr:hypothetical protein [Rubrivivax sp.]